MSTINCVILTADSALCRGNLAEIFPGETLSTGELTAGVNEGVAGSIPDRFLAGGIGMFCKTTGGFPSGGTAIFKRTGSPSAHLL